MRDAIDEFQAELNVIRARHPGCEPELVADLARAILGALRAHGTPSRAIVLATDQLEATLAHTASATDRILDVCELLDRMARELGGRRGRRAREASPRLRDATRRIYEACGFQDITGQRITKAADAIKAIEAGIEHVMSALCPAQAGSGLGQAPADRWPRSLDGPQAPASAMAQGDIDRLLASLG